MSALPTNLRRQLENAIKQARKIAERGARKALEALAVHEPNPYRHMDEAQRGLRRKLRAQAKQLGDGENKTGRGAHEIKHLVEKLAYDQWHRLLFARFLLENDLLISPEHGVSVSLVDCEELAPSEGLKDAWAVAARFAANELPEIFRAADPVGTVELPVEDRNPLIQLVTGLPPEVYTAADSIGWCYQFWQAERKDEINASGRKIGADELPAVTQLFTEDYMVDFLLDNTLGAWHAGNVLAANPTLAKDAQNEDELRGAVALPGCSWKSLRFIRANDSKWGPAAGAFDSWPETAKELKCLDPCMGSGHFIVAIFERLVALRTAEEGLDEAVAVAAVIRDNLFGLEIDPRCTQIAAFNLALAAWRHVGHCLLPAMNLACSGLAPNTQETDWLAIAGDNQKLRNGMERLYQLFKNAPVLGSLINPRLTADDMFVADFPELQPLLEKALSREAKDDTAHEMAVTARGVAKAAEILVNQFTLVATNVPYLGMRKQDEIMREFCDAVHPSARADLATAFVERCTVFCASGGTATLVTPQNWLFLTTYTKLRKTLLAQQQWDFVAKLGARAFRMIGGEVVNVVLLALTNKRPADDQILLGLDVSEEARPSEKSISLVGSKLVINTQLLQLNHPDARIVIGGTQSETLLSDYSYSAQGIGTTDNPRFVQCVWEQASFSEEWETFQSGATDSAATSGSSTILRWGGPGGDYFKHIEALRRENRIGGGWQAGGIAWGRKGFAVNVTGTKFVTGYSQGKFDTTIGVIVPNNETHEAPILCYLESKRYTDDLIEIDPTLSVTEGTLIKVPFDLARWQKVALEKYPRGLPKPSSGDPTQWIFHGQPKGSDQSLHVAMARLLGYRWPRQTGSSFLDAPSLGPDGLEKLADRDGIVCLSATKGEAPAAERLRGLLMLALGKFDVSVLIPKGSKSVTLEEWLRDEFFEQHCAIFHHRPFLWHIWDGHKSGFGALVNYHQLNRANLEKLTYAYLGDWIRRQQAAVDAGDPGSDARLQAARQLQFRLKLILEGEPPYDLFVRWKPLSKQAIGWHPDINDGVRLNIRPFLDQNIAGGKKGAGILRTKPNIKWEKDRGKEPVRDKKDFPWLWGWDEEQQDFAGAGKEPDGNRWNDCHYTKDFKASKAR
jgi:Eco57I restriction-modification methylase